VVLRCIVMDPIPPCAWCSVLAANECAEYGGMMMMMW
jgi:hypothetical protein